LKKTDTNVKAINIMLGELDRIELIMNEFLFLAKPSRPTFRQYRLGALIDDVLELFRLQAESAKVVVHSHYSAELPDIVCDDNQLKQVLVNVVKNALEAMPTGGELSIDVLMERDTVITITDTGCGIPEHELERIGEPFYTTKANGNGLGMLICHNIINNHKGSLAITSVLGQGTIVSIRLPARGL
jgi:signal transduction histidine kinase